MSVQSEAAKRHIERLLKLEYHQVPISASEMKQNGGCFKNATIRSIQKDMIDGGQKAFKEYIFTDEANWRFDYAVPSIHYANRKGLPHHFIPQQFFSFPGEIELDGGTFQSIRTGHASGVGLRNWREKNNAAMTAGWQVWHYAPEEVIKAGRKTLPDEPILKRLPWMCEHG